MHQDLLGQSAALKLNYKRKYRGPAHLSITTIDVIDPNRVNRSLEVLPFYDIDRDHGERAVFETREFKSTSMRHAAL
jgi:hypothetical protein